MMGSFLCFVWQFMKIVVSLHRVLNEHEDLPVGARLGSKNGCLTGNFLKKFINICEIYKNVVYLHRI